jgi:cytidylate kinase
LVLPSEEMEIRDGNKTLEGYSNSDFAIDKSDRMSILRNVFILAGGLVSWMSRKQMSVSTSTMEAEYMAISVYIKRS